MNPVNMIKSLIRWAVVNSLSSDDQDFPIHQIGYMGKTADAAAWYPYGYHANPGSETLALFFAVGANPENRVMMPGSPKERIDALMPTPLAEGEVVMYHPTTKSYVHFKANGDIEVDSQKDVNIRVVGNSKIDVQGNVDIDAGGTLDLDSVGAMKITAPTLLMTTDLTIIGNIIHTGDGDLALTGELGLGVAFASGLKVAAITSDTADADRVSQGSPKVRVIGPMEDA